MLKIINRVFLAILLLLSVGSILFSILILSIPDLLGSGLEFESVTALAKSPEFVLLPDTSSIKPIDSPYEINYTVKTPQLKKFDQLYIEVYDNGRFIGDVDCLENFSSYQHYKDKTEFTCTANIPYDYSKSENYLVFATIYGETRELASDPVTLKIDWTGYENTFWQFSLFFIFATVIAYLVILLPLTLFAVYLASKVKHSDAFSDDYALSSILNPFAGGKTLLQKFNSFIASPYFWIFEIIGVLIILFYMLLTAQIWKSPTAFTAFFLSGLMAFVIPYLWCLAWWYADFKEREPLRLLVTLFLWGMLAALMSIGINSLTGVIFELVGLGFLSAFLIAPIVEEFHKGMGVVLFGEHHEFNSIEDGLVFGFVIGMGFSFIEDWVYLLSSPMGSDFWSWISLFIFRSMLFSANHGLYTAITGGIIGFIIERGFRAPALGIIIAVPIAAFFHAMHNSGELLSAIFGTGGTLAYCCLLIPLFDYGGLILLVILFLWALFRKRN